MTSVDLLVLGAGVSGLMAARRAAARGLSVLVLEQGDHVGGRAASFEVGGMRVDHGSRRLHPAVDADLLADLRSLLGDDLQTRPRQGRLDVGGHWISFPLKGADLATRLPRRLAIAAARDAALAPTRRQHGDSYASVLRAGLGPALYEAVYGPYARKLWGLDGEQLDAEQARSRIAADGPLKMAGRLLRRNRLEHSTGHGAVFHYPRKGFGQIPEALAQAAVDDGATIVTGASLGTLHARTDGVRLLWEGGEVQAGQAFSTLPMTSLARVARPAPSAQVVGDASALVFRAMVLVHVVHEGGRWTPFDAHYLPTPGTPVSRLSEPANYRVSADDPTDRTVVCAEIPCAVGDATWDASDDDLVAVVQDAVQRLGLPPLRVGGHEVRRVRRVYPVYRKGYAERLAGLDAWSERLAHVTTFGRLGLFVHDNTHHALRMGWDAVECLRTDGAPAPGSRSPVGMDHRCWQDARERYRRHVVED
ncbi:FAD-dependent oxidoreductase [Angustibacter peucedani]